MGPIGVANHLTPYLPGHPVITTGGERAIHAVSAAPWGSASILLIWDGYIRMLGAEGATNATRYAILNANYLKARLEPHYPVLYARDNGRVAHELIFDLRAFKAAGIEEMDVAKRLMDYGFHAPTVVPGRRNAHGRTDGKRGGRGAGSILRCHDPDTRRDRGRGERARRPDRQCPKNAPHTAEAVSATDWRHPYTREEAAYPLPFVRTQQVLAADWPD